MQTPIVDIRQLSVDFKTVDGTEHVLRDVNLSIGEGEIVGLVGETGCGKSATAKLLLGILPMPPARIVGGAATLFGHDLMSMSARQRDQARRHIAYVPQDPMAALNPSFAIGEQMIDLIVWDRCGRSLGAYLRMRHRRMHVESARAHAEELLRKVYIADPGDVLSRYPVQLSGGMRQRVLLAMALSGAPRLMIADEPTTALDVTVQKRTIELIRELVHQEKLAGLYITHDLGVAREICDRTYVMYGGSTVECGPTPQLLDSPLHPYTRGLIEAIPRLTGGLPKGIPGQVPDYLRPPSGCRFEPRCSQRVSACSTMPAWSAVDEDAGRFVACWLHAGRALESGTSVSTAM